MTCRCDCVNCNSGGHAGCYYETLGIAECQLIELVARALHRTYFHPEEKHQRMEELYQESKPRMHKQARAAIQAYEDHVREERKVNNRAIHQRYDKEW